MSRGPQTVTWLCNELQKEKGLRSYICEEDWMCKICECDLKEDTKEIVRLIEKLFDEIEEETDQSIDEFYIGKTYVDEREDEVFDQMDPCTMTFSGVRSRFCYHRKRDYGKDGLVVLTVGKSEDYILKLEKKLIKSYNDSPKLANKSTKPGRKSSTKKAGYALYVAFTLEED